MTGHTETYHLRDAQRQSQLQQFANISPSDVTGEAAVLRLMVQESLDSPSPNPGLVALLCGQLAKLSEAHTRTQVRAGELLARSAVLELGRQIVDLLATELCGRFSGWEDALDAIATKLAAIVEAANNQPRLENR